MRQLSVWAQNHSKSLKPRGTNWPCTQLMLRVRAGCRLTSECLVLLHGTTLVMWNGSSSSDWGQPEIHRKHFCNSCFETQLPHKKREGEEHSVAILPMYKNHSSCMTAACLHCPFPFKGIGGERHFLKIRAKASKLPSYLYKRYQRASFVSGEIIWASTNWKKIWFAPRFDYHLESAPLHW